MVYILLMAAALLVLYTFIKYKLSRKAFDKHAAQIPGPPTLPLIGNGHLFFNIKSVEGLWVTLENLFSQYVKFGIGRIYLGPKLIIGLTDQRYIKAVFSSTLAIDKDPIYSTVFGEAFPGIFVQNGKTWQIVRKALLKVFHSKKVENTLDVILTNAEILSEKFSQNVDKGVFDVRHMMAYCSLSNTCEGLCGVQTGEDVEEKNTFIKWLKIISEILLQRAVKPQYLFDPIFKMSPAGRVFTKNLSSFGSISRKIITKRMEILNEKRKNKEEDSGTDCYTDTIIKLGKEKGFTFEKTSYWMNDFLMAGFETTSVTTSSMLVFLGMYPEYQEKVYEEQRQIFGDSDRLPSLTDLNEMTYLKMVYYETLRHVCPPAIMRKTTGDIKLDNYTIPKGAGIYLSFYKLHRNPEFWEFPTKFYPDHFLPENVAKRPKLCFTPFSAGPRICPGKYFAELMTKVTISTLCRRFIFTTPLTYDAIQYKYSLMSEFVNGFPVEVKKRVKIENIGS